MSKTEVKNIFGWLDEITVKKSHPNTFSQNSWDNWNSYLMHRWISQNPDYIDIVNYVQKINPQNKQQIYSIYRELIPKKKQWNKYIKNQNKSTYQDIIKYVVKYFECSSKEADNYINILKRKGVEGILKDMGIEDKEIKKLIKKSKL